jgi:hypothetical protein
MSALQVRPAIQVAPVVFVVQTAVPVGVAPLLLHESFLHSTYSGGPLLVSLFVLLAGAAVLARSPLLLALMAPEAAQTSDESGTADSRSAPSSAASGSSERSDAAEPSSVTTTTSPARSGR